MTPSTRRHLLTALVACALVGVGALGAWRHRAVQEAERAAGVETSRIRTWARSHTAAGVSVLPKRVPAAARRQLKQLDHLPGFDAYARRCGSCHGLPDPGAYPPKRWIGKVNEMGRHIERAGVMPPEEGEMAAAATFLGEAAAALRPGEAADTAS